MAPDASKKRKRLSANQNNDSPQSPPESQVQDRTEWTNGTDPLHNSGYEHSSHRSKDAFCDSEEEQDDDEEPVSPLQKTRRVQHSSQKLSQAFVRPLNAAKTKGPHSNTAGTIKAIASKTFSSKAGASKTGASKAVPPKSSKPPRSILPTMAKPSPRARSAALSGGSTTPQSDDESDKSGSVGQIQHIKYIKYESEAMERLEVLNRQQFICGLNKANFEGPIHAVFPNMATTHQTFKQAVIKTQRDFRNWKAAVTRNIKSFIVVYMNDRTDNAALLECISYRKLKEFLKSDFQRHWMSEIFAFVGPAIDFDTISDLGMEFMKYAFIQLAVHIRLTGLLEETGNEDLAKYTPDHYSNVFDGLYLRQEFKDITLDDFPIRRIPLTTKRGRKRAPIDPNDDTDGEL